MVFYFSGFSGLTWADVGVSRSHHVAAFSRKLRMYGMVLTLPPPSPHVSPTEELDFLQSGSEL